VRLEEDPVTSDYDYLRVIGAMVLVGTVALASQGVSDHLLWGPLKATASEPAPGQVFKVVNKDQFEGKWRQFKGDLKKQYGKLTDDDLLQIEGNYDKFEGKMQERYGNEKEELRRWTDEWFDKHEFEKTRKKS